MPGNIRARIVIDGEIALDGSLGDWQNRPPELFRDMIKPGARLDPGMQALMVAFRHSAMSGRSYFGATLTHGPGDEFDLSVTYDYLRRRRDQ